MMKKVSKILMLFMVLLVLAGCSNDMKTDGTTNAKTTGSEAKTDDTEVSKTTEAKESNAETGSGETENIETQSVETQSSETENAEATSSASEQAKTDAEETADTTEKYVEQLPTRVVMITDGANVDEGDSNIDLWKAVSTYCEANNINCASKKPLMGSRMDYYYAMSVSVEEDATIMIMRGQGFETALYDIQEEFPEIYFVIIDGKPRGMDGVYETKQNTVSITMNHETESVMDVVAEILDLYMDGKFPGGQDLRVGTAGTLVY